MRTATLLWLAAVVLSAQDARGLLQEVVNQAMTAQGWHAEVVSTADRRGEGVSPRIATITLEATFQRPRSCRVEISGEKADSRARYVSDGESLWTWSLKQNQYRKDPGSECPVHSFFAQYPERLLSGLESATITGQADVQVDEHPAPCTMVRAMYTAPSGRAEATFWIGREGKRILREEWSVHLAGGDKPIELTRTVKVLMFEWNPTLPKDRFSFEAPPGAREASGEDVLSFCAPCAVPTYRPDPGYTEEARRAAISGSVVLVFVVDEQGLPQNVRVIRGLGYGLDEKAVETLRRWRFLPGLMDGMPTKMPARVEMTFRTFSRPLR